MKSDCTLGEIISAMKMFLEHGWLLVVFEVRNKFGPIYVDHIGIATHNVEEASKFWRLLGLIEGKEDEIVEEQGED